jgi:type IV secretory pathway VirJ component
VKRLLAVAVLLLSSSASFAGITAERCEGIADVRGLPLIELSAKRVDAKHHRFAIMLTGDGGWRRIDVRVTNRFREEGIPVVGFLTPEYFSTLRTADESACALERTIRFYRTLWKCDRVLLIGYSRGADILPFMLSRLPADVRASVDVVALLGLERSIDFRYHRSWIPFYHPKETQYAVLPEVQKLRDYRLLCFYGEKEKDSLCHALDPQMATIIRERGSHHFAGNYSGIADAILRAVSEVAAEPAP